MTIEEVVKKAKYIQFPEMNQSYNDYSSRDVVKMPIIEGEDVLYTGMPRDNGHHYTTAYTYKYVLPSIGKLLNFRFSMDDFDLVNVNNGIYDLSYIKPKKLDNYTIISYTDKERFNGDYRVLINPNFFKRPLYRELYRYPHKCSRIINNTSRTMRTLMISGDSQMIPSIAPLAHYFKEVWYFDNRTGYYKEDPNGPFIYHENEFRSFAHTYKDMVFSDVLIECYCRELSWYEYLNLQ